MERYTQIEHISEQEARQSVALLFPEKANLYAVLDFAVCFGIYENGHFSVGLDGQTAPVPLEWKYLQEIRIFDEEKELFLVPFDRGWTGRIRRDIRDGEEDEKRLEYFIDERQKLWGKSEEEHKFGIPGWSLLVSERGTKILIPVDIGKSGEEAALFVRRYMRVPNVEKNEELVFQNDIRMVNFCSWKGDDGKNGNV